MTRTRSLYRTSIINFALLAVLFTVFKLTGIAISAVALFLFTTYIIGNYTYPELRGASLGTKLFSTLTGVFFPTVFVSAASALWAVAFHPDMISPDFGFRYPALVFPAFIVTMLASFSLVFVEAKLSTEKTAYPFHRHYTAIVVCGGIFALTIISMALLVLL